MVLLEIITGTIIYKNRKKIKKYFKKKWEEDPLSLEPLDKDMKERFGDDFI